MLEEADEPTLEQMFAEHVQESVAMALAIALEVEKRCLGKDVSPGLHARVYSRTEQSRTFTFHSLEQLVSCGVSGCPGSEYHDPVGQPQDKDSSGGVEGEDPNPNPDS